MISDELKKKITDIQGRYEVKRAALIPALHLVCDEYGWISGDACVELAELFEMKPVQVREVASFYSMFPLEETGKYVIKVCKTLSCFIMGAENILEHIQKRLNIGLNETTKDKKFTLMTFECLGACDKAPVMQINDKQYEHLTIEKVDKILDGLN